MLKKFLLIPLIVLTIAMAGCAPKGPTTTFKGQYYPQCFDPITRLCQDQDNTERAKSAGKGAAMGALTGALIGAATGGWREALIGAAVGAAAGGIAGYAYQHIKEIKDQDQRLEAYKAQFGKEAQDLDLQKASTLSAYKCYEEQLRLVKQAVRNKTMSKKEAQARIAEISAGLEELKKFWDDRSSQFAAQQQEADKLIAEEAVKAKTEAAKSKVGQMNVQHYNNKRAVSQNNMEVGNAREQALALLNDARESAAGAADV